MTFDPNNGYKMAIDALEGARNSASHHRKTLIDRAVNFPEGQPTRDAFEARITEIADLQDNIASLIGSFLDVMGTRDPD